MILIGIDPGSVSGAYALLDHQLDLEIRLADDVLRALALDRESRQPVEIAFREGSRIVDDGFSRLVAGARLLVEHRQSFQSQAAPRTPLESPCLALTMGV